MHDNNISTMSTLLSIASLKAEGAAPRYEQIANALCQAIRTGQLKPGDRLPTLRRLASELEVSLTTVTAAFKSLAESGWTRGEIGRGTSWQTEEDMSPPLLQPSQRIYERAPLARCQSSLAQTGAGELDGEAAFDFS